MLKRVMWSLTNMYEGSIVLVLYVSDPEVTKLGRSESFKNYQHQKCVYFDLSLI